MVLAAFFTCKDEQTPPPVVEKPVVVVPPEEPVVDPPVEPVDPPVEPEKPETPVTGDEVYVKTGVVENVEGYFWIYAECTGYEISIDGDRHYKPDSLPDEFKERHLRVRITYRISDKKHVCGTGVPGDSAKRELAIINIIKIEKL